MIKLALTGSIGMGKSTTAALFAARGVPVYDADAAVHEAYARGGEAVAQIEWAFPGVMTEDGAIDRNLLRQRVLNNSEAMKKLEGIIHPIIGVAQRDFLARAAQAGADVIVLDIPLLFETGGDKRADAIAVVSAPADVQRARVMARGMTEADFEAILARQTPDSVKRSRADFVINTGLGFDYAGAQVDAILAALRAGAYAAAWRRGARPEAEADDKDETCAKSSSTLKPPASTPGPGDRIVELGCVELINYLPTGREFQIYVNPGRPVSEATVRITGITNDTLRGKPGFSHPDVVDTLMAFLGEDMVVAHNAEFDRGFLNHELSLLGRQGLPKERFIDTVDLARKHRPGSPASLDAVCKRFNISLDARQFHGALLDAKLLAMCYLELRGGRERKLDFATAAKAAASSALAARGPRLPRPEPLASRLTQEEAAAHNAFIASLTKDGSAIWKKYA